MPSGTDEFASSAADRRKVIADRCCEQRSSVTTMHKVYHQHRTDRRQRHHGRGRGRRLPRTGRGTTSSAGTSLAQVIRLDGDRVSLQVFAGSRGISTDAKVRFLGHPMQVPFSRRPAGPVFNGSGEPRDKGPALTREPDRHRRPVGQPGQAHHPATTWSAPASR